MHIARVAESNVNAFYRSQGPLAELRAHGHRVTEVPAPADLPRDVDVVHIHRRCDPVTQRIAEAGARQGAAVVWDDDDDLSAIPRGDPRHAKLGGLSGARRLTAVRRMLALADLVTAPSAGLIARFGELGARDGLVVENQLAQQFLVAARPHDGLVVGWVAGLEHRADIERVPIRAVLERLLGEHRELRVVTVGLALGIDHPRYVHVPPIQLGELPAQIAGFDVGIAPLADIPFNRARSNIKLKEYAGAGVPWLASDFGPYAGLGEDQGGRLVADDNWLPALARLIDAKRDRKRLAKRALRWGRSQTIAANAGAWEAACERAVANRRAAAGERVARA
jgi:hypothetical protein